MSAVVVSSAGTGAGKTLVTSAIAAVLRADGRRVQPYKIGPDYIDARFAEATVGRPAYNVDLWLDGAHGACEHVARTRGDADVLLFEGMMGLFDGDDAGLTSTAAVAKLVDAAVVVVLDGWTASQTVAAVALGLRDYDPALRFAGAILNRVGGAAHERAMRAACARAGIPVLAAIRYDPALVVPERHLGLDPAGLAAREAAVQHLAATLSGTLDRSVFSGRAEGAAHPTAAAGGLRSGAADAAPRIAVAHDDAFWFTYPETLVALERVGAEVVRFSPLTDAALPAGTAALWIGGGYPEAFAARLQANGAMCGSVRRAVADGMPTYAECGGFMYLLEKLETPDGRFAMVGALPGGTSIARPVLTIGYREAVTAAATPLDPAGVSVRAYAYHYATPQIATSAPAYHIDDAGALASDGIAWPSGSAAFLHRHFLADDPAIARFVDHARRYAAHSPSAAYAAITNKEQA